MKRIALTTLALTLLCGTSVHAQGLAGVIRERQAAERSAAAQAAPAQREEARPARQERSEAPRAAQPQAERPQAQPAQVAQAPRQTGEGRPGRPDFGGQGQRSRDGGSVPAQTGQPRQPQQPGTQYQPRQPQQTPQANPAQQGVDRAFGRQPQQGQPPQGQGTRPDRSGGYDRDGRQDGRPGDRGNDGRDNSGGYNGGRYDGDRNNNGGYNGRDPRQGAGGAWDSGRRPVIRPEDRRDRDYNRPRYDERRYPRYVTPRSRYQWHGPSYRPPIGFYYQTWRWGQTLPWSWYTPNYYLNDWWNYGLPMPPAGCEWVRVGDDAILVNVFTGRIYQVVYNLFW